MSGRTLRYSYGFLLALAGCTFNGHAEWHTGSGGAATSGSEQPQAQAPEAQAPAQPSTEVAAAPTPSAPSAQAPAPQAPAPQAPAPSSPPPAAPAPSSGANMGAIASGATGRGGALSGVGTNAALGGSHASGSSAGAAVPGIGMGAIAGSQGAGSKAPSTSANGALSGVASGAASAGSTSTNPAPSSGNQGALSGVATSNVAQAGSSVPGLDAGKTAAAGNPPAGSNVRGHDPMGPKPSEAWNRPVEAAPNGPQTVAGSDKPASGQKGANKALSGAAMGALTQPVCALVSSTARAGERVRVRVKSGNDAAQVRLGDRPLNVVSRGSEWLVELPSNAQSGQLSLVRGDATLTCGQLSVSPRP